jgi:2-succinyl-5-enolpyruvyl-6-hydroxy-3-cyclohexene-1-carboxylate synthase
LAPDPDTPAPLGSVGPVPAGAAAASATATPPAQALRAGTNVRAALTLLLSLRQAGLGTVVVCPGSRSGPLAVAAALLEPGGLRLKTALDERSAAFFALGCGRGDGSPAAVITTSGSAVAHLLPAAVEADYGAIPLLLLTADRPQRLKNCGANQCVNQERFLLASCRWYGQAKASGLGSMEPVAIERLAQRAMAEAKGLGGQPPGAVHLNLPLDEPLHATPDELQALAKALGQGQLQIDGPEAIEPDSDEPDSDEPDPDGPEADQPQANHPEANHPTADQPEAAEPDAAEPDAAEPDAAERHAAKPQAARDRLDAPSPLFLSPPALTVSAPAIDPDRPGLILAGPWRGPLAARADLIEALAAWQRRCGWPLLADALSGLRGCPELEVIAGYDLILQDPPAALAPEQVLRLGPLPASRRLQDWLQRLEAVQGLISDGDPRPLDPLRRCAWQWHGGFSAWLAAQAVATDLGPAPQSLALTGAWRRAEARIQHLLNQQLPTVGVAPVGTAALPPALEAGAGGEAASAEGGAADGSVPCGGALKLSEPWLARQLARLLPPQLPVMLANSSPVRDWESFSPADAPARPIFSFRGASGIDGTLSIACGLAEALGELVLISGDLALLHDSAGWLWRQQLGGRLSVVLIDNGGGGIFEQLPIRAGSAFDFERLFAMPQPLDPLHLAQLHGVPCARLRDPQVLPRQLRQLLERPAEQPLGLLAVTTHAGADASLRQRLRRQSAMALNQDPAVGVGPVPTMASEPLVPGPPRP